MLRYSPIALIVFLLITCTSTPEINQEIVSHEGEQILVGKVDLVGLGEEPYKSWFDENYRNYVVNETALLGADLSDVTIQLFLGTWCFDSQLQVPQFIKILNSVDYNLAGLTMIGLDNHPERDLQSPQNEEEGMDIGFVPTFIFYRDGKEIGRIVEFPVRTLEEDLRSIVEGK